MTTEQSDQQGSTEPVVDADADAVTDTDSTSRPYWWHSSHPTFAALTGFFAGMLFVTALPGGFFGLLRLLFSDETAEQVFPLVLLIFLVPLAMLVRRKTRRFGMFMLVGMVLTTLVVLGVSSLVLYFMVQADV